MHSPWFSCAMAFRITTENKINEHEWEEKLKQLAHIDIKPSQEQSIGFSPVFGYLAPNMQSHKAQNFFYISMTVEEKKIPNSKLKKLVRLAVKDRAKKQNIKVEDIGKDEIKGIEESIKAEMIQKTIASEYYINAFIDTTNNVIFIDDTSPKKFEILKKWLLRIEPSIAFVDFFDASLEIYLTSWVFKPENLPRSLSLGYDLTLAGSEKERASLTNQDLYSEEVTTLIKHDKKVVDISLVYEGRLAFKIKENGVLSKIKPTDLLKGNINQHKDDGAVAFLESNWILMADELCSVFDWFHKNADVQNSSPNKDNNGPNNVVQISEKVDNEKEGSEGLESMRI